MSYETSTGVILTTGGVKQGETYNIVISGGEIEADTNNYAFESGRGAYISGTLIAVAPTPSDGGGTTKSTMITDYGGSSPTKTETSANTNDDGSTTTTKAETKPNGTTVVTETTTNTDGSTTEVKTETNKDGVTEATVVIDGKAAGNGITSGVGGNKFEL